MSSCPTPILEPRETASPVLVAGRDPARRAAVLDELSEVLPARTRFAQAGTLPETLIRAPESRMVVLSGELDDVSAESLLHLLARRHPGLPMVSLEGTAGR